MNIGKAIRVVAGMILCIMSTMIATCVLAVKVWLAVVYLLCAVASYLAPIADSKTAMVLLAVPAIMVFLALFCYPLLLSI